MIDLSKIFPKSPNAPTCEIALGRKLPWPEYTKTGDYTAVILNAKAFDVVISLTGLTRQEEDAIADEEFDVFITETELAPFLIFQFGNVFKCDFTINMKKMNPDNVEYWFKSKADSINIYLLEGKTAKVKAIRVVPFPEMDALKQTCLSQFNHSKEEIDRYIHAVYSQYPIERLMQLASIRFSVDAALIL